MKEHLEKPRKGLLILSWALYDLANQFFALNVVSLYFVRWVTIEKGVIFWGVILLFLSPLGELGYRIALFSLNLFIVFALIFLLRMNRRLSNNHLPR